MISLATIRLTDGSNEYDVNTLLTRPGSIIGEWQEISDYLRQHVSQAWRRRARVMKK